MPFAATSDGASGRVTARSHWPESDSRFQLGTDTSRRWWCVTRAGDLGRVDLIDPREDSILAPLYLLDRVANADGHRAPVELDTASESPATSKTPDELPPLLKRILAEYSATGMPPSYLPKNHTPKKGQA